MFNQTSGQVSRSIYRQLRIQTTIPKVYAALVSLVLIGLSSKDCVDVRLDSAVGVSALAVFDGTTMIPHPLPTTLQLCSTFKPEVDS